MGKMAVDKKNEGGHIRCTILKAIGDCYANPKVLPLLLCCRAASAAASDDDDDVVAAAAAAVP